GHPMGRPAKPHSDFTGRQLTIVLFHKRNFGGCPLCPVITMPLCFTHLASSFYITHDVFPAPAYRLEPAGAAQPAESAADVAESLQVAASAAESVLPPAQPAGSLSACQRPAI